MDYGELIRALAEKIGVEVAPDGDGTCQLAVDDMRVTIQNLDELRCVSTFAEIGEPPPENPTSLYEAMLAANHLFQGTSGATISRDPGNGKLFLCRCDPMATLDGESFANNLEKFVNTLETWRKLVAEYRPDEGGKKAVDDEAGLPSFGGSFMQV